MERVPPAHSVTVTASSRRTRRYLHFPEPEPLLLDSDEEYEEATREVLEMAVRCRLRGRDDVGVVLSGGIDSSALVATASYLGPVHSYSAVADRDETNESANIRATAARLGLDATFVTPDRVEAACGDFRSAMAHEESPFTSGAMLQTLFWSAQRDGRRSVITGMMADEVVGISAAVAMRCLLAEHRYAELVGLARVARQSRQPRSPIRVTTVGTLRRSQSPAGG